VGPPHDEMHIGAFFPLAHQAQIGKKAPVVALSQLKILIRTVLT
jgi:hypothetical protein